MLGNYARLRLFEQARAVAFIVVYLGLFQVLVLGMAPFSSLRSAMGIGLVVLGLTLFLEGLFLGLMPIGERVGVKLPQRAGLAVIVVFGLLLGLGSTLAEPAVAALRVMGGFVNAWEAPVLFHLLENTPERLVIAVGAGVGLAVACGMVRLYFGLSIKPFIYVLVPIMLVLSLYCGMDSNLATVLGLAWDTGAVTTGAVTVPLVLALGIGVSRAIGKQKESTGGFGMIMLASAFPVLTVLALGIWTNISLPQMQDETDFFAIENRQHISKLFESETQLTRHAYQKGSEAGRRALHGNRELHEKAVRSLNAPESRSAILGEMPLSIWIRDRASEWERHQIFTSEAAAAASAFRSRSMPAVLKHELASAVRSVVPLTALLLVVLFLFLRDRLRHHDEAILGIGMSLIGMAILTSGIRTGLAPMGEEAGRALPRLFRSEQREDSRVWLEPFDPSKDTFVVYLPNGERSLHFQMKNPRGSVRNVLFDPLRYHAETLRYEHIVQVPPLFSANLNLAGIGLALLFAFGLGYGSTLAEPALSALGRKVEDITVGTVKRKGVVRAVSIGVGLGLVAGMVRILYDLPTIWLIVPPYLLLLLLTYWSEEEFAGIAWDCGGVTTGVVTVPLVMAMGLSVGGELNVVDGFGALALASAYPVLTVLLHGLILRGRQQRSMRIMEARRNE